MSRGSLKASSKGIKTAKNALMSRGLTQKALGEELEIGRSTISKFFNHKSIDRWVFLEICHRLDLDWQEIFETPQEGRNDIKDFRFSQNYYYFYISPNKIKQLLGGKEITKNEKLDPEIKQIIENSTNCLGKVDEYRSLYSSLEELFSRFSSDDRIQDLNSNQSDFLSIEPGLGYAELDLKRTKENQVNEDILTLHGEICQMNLVFDCSAKYFFGYDKNEKKFNYNSANCRFLGGTVAYTFRTHFFILSTDLEQKIAYCSPIYLALPEGILK